MWTTFVRSLNPFGGKGNSRWIDAIVNENNDIVQQRMTIIIAFIVVSPRFKHFYLMLRLQHKADFPGLVSYNRFVQLMPSLVIPLCAYLQTCYGKDTGIAFIDSTALAVCGNKRIRRNRVFRGLAKLGKTTMGWFFGFKLHLVINERGELLAVTLTPGNVDDRKPVASLARRLAGKLFGDKGYISAELFHVLWEQGVQLITSLRRNMKNILMPLMDKILLRKRSLIETVNDQLKNIAQVEHTRHRSVLNFAVNLVAGLISSLVSRKSRPYGSTNAIGKPSTPTPYHSSLKQNSGF